MLTQIFKKAASLTTRLSVNGKKLKSYQTKRPFKKQWCHISISIAAPLTARVSDLENPFSIMYPQFRPGYITGANTFSSHPATRVVILMRFRSSGRTSWHLASVAWKSRSTSATAGTSRR